MDRPVIAFEENVRGPQKVDFGAFGREFVRLVLTPRLFAKKISEVLPPSISGESPAVNWGDLGVGKVTYAASGMQALVGPGQQLGQYIVHLKFRITINVKLGISKQYVIDVTAPFLLNVMTYHPVVIFINYAEVQGQQLVLNCVSSHTDAVDQQIYPKVEQQLRELVPKQINQQLANSYNSRIIDVTKMQAGTSMALLNALADGDWEQEAHVQSKAAVQISYEKFGHNFMQYVITPAMLSKEISAAIWSSQHGSNKLDFDGNIEGHHVMYAGHVTCSPVTLVQSAQDHLRFQFEVYAHLDFKVDVPGGRESWLFDLTAPVQFDAETWAGTEALLFFKMYRVDPGNVIFRNKQISLTGIAWHCGDLGNRVPKEVAGKLNTAFDDAYKAGSTTRNITRMAAQS